MIAIIPARGGSKRLPGKNIKLLNGKPLIAYTIEAAKKCKYINDVVVTTDCPEIAKVAELYGAKVPGLRPDFLSSDTASSNDVVKYIIEKMKEEYNKEVYNCVLLQPTSPLRNEQHISEAIELFTQKEADAVISFTKEHHPLYWNKYINEEGVLEEINSLLPQESFYPNGAVYVLSLNVIENGIYYTDRTYGYIMDRENSIDIDTQEDWNYVEFLINNKRK